VQTGYIHLEPTVSATNQARGVINLVTSRAQMAYTEQLYELCSNDKLTQQYLAVRRAPLRYTSTGFGRRTDSPDRTFYFFIMKSGG